MFQEIQTYHGNLINASGEGEQFPSNEQVENENLTAAEEIIAVARQEAAALLEEAREQAIRERDDLLIEATREAENIVAIASVEKVSRLNMELGSSRTAMVEVLENALERIIGEIGKDKATSLAILNALKDFRDEKGLKIQANVKTIERLQLFAVGRRQEFDLMGIDFIRDPSVEEGRCILSTGEERMEVGIEAQLAALKKLFDSEREAGNQFRRGD